MCYPIDIIWEKARSKGLYQPGMTSNWRCLHVLLPEPLRTFCTNVPFPVPFPLKYLDTKIILIDGERMAELMIDHNVGVSPIASYEIKKIDSDYFLEE